VYKKSLEMRHFLVFHYPEEPKLARSWAAGVARDRKAEQTAPMVAVGCIIDAAQDAKTEMLARMETPDEILARRDSTGTSEWLGDQPMAVQKKKLIATGFALVGVVSLAAAVLPAIKGQSLNVTFLCVSVFWLILSAVVWRTPGGRAA